MAIKTFTTGEVLTASDTNTYLANSGLVLLNPTSVTNGTVTSGQGTVRVAGTATTVTINGVFSATQEDYLIVSKLSFTGGDVTFQLTSAGTPAGGTSYNYSMMQAYAGAGVTTTRTAGVANHVFMSNGGGVYQSCTMDVFAPFLAQATLFQVQNLRNDASYGVPANYLWYGNNDNATSYDGFRLTGAGNITGTIAVYGRRL